MYKISIIRQSSQAVQTLGEFILTVNEVECYKGVTLELPWLDNRHSISCIPVGTYKLEPWNSKKFGHCLHVLNVPDRDAILIHKGNFFKDTHGCILVGKGYSDINKDGYLDITSSGIALSNIILLIKGDGVLTIA